ncbi:uncharacterized protein A4U43_C06F19050 [Asparagus officinalis]|uniref:Uncharacterized protein n=1 Tax=Asparagus officinalis TaxID=4686 RepID=A0A5P1EMV4_ASPOF|nr:uncharacterized protein A4U43_C06F19050 [Asparagus officinalis]
MNIGNSCFSAHQPVHAAQSLAEVQVQNSVHVSHEKGNMKLNNIDRRKISTNRLPVQSGSFQQKNIGMSSISAQLPVHAVHSQVESCAQHEYEGLQSGMESNFQNTGNSRFSAQLLVHAAQSLEEVQVQNSVHVSNEKGNMQLKNIDRGKFLQIIYLYNV